jgi:hypothetical protein
MPKTDQKHVRTLRGWAISVLDEVGAIRECEEHGWMQDRTDPHARERAYDIARRDPPNGATTEAAARAIVDVLESIGDTCLVTRWIDAPIQVRPLQAGRSVQLTEAAFLPSDSLGRRVGRDLRHREVAGMLDRSTFQDDFRQQTRAPERADQRSRYHRLL